MPLTMARPGEQMCIRKITGKDETRKFLGNLGFTTGEKVTIVSELAGNVIINVRDTRVALSKALAQRIMV